MTRRTYAQLSKLTNNQKLTIRDHLAIERTALASERTLLSYVRTMIGLMAVGGTLIKFFTGWLAMLSGWMFITFGLTVLTVGFIRYIKMIAIIHHLQNPQSNQPKIDKFHQIFWTTLEKLHLAERIIR
jgi:putative membrane protein